MVAANSGLEGLVRSGKHNRVLLVGDPHENLLGYLQALQVAENRGVSAKNTIVFGDWLYELQSQHTLTMGKRAKGIIQDLESGLNAMDDPNNPGTSTHLDNIKNGLYSQNTLNRVLKPLETAKKAVRNVARHKLQQFHDANPHARKLTGNWDHLEASQEVFGDTLYTGDVAHLEGFDIAMASGGGQEAVRETGGVGGFDVDGPRGEGKRHERLVEPLRSGAKIMATHVRPFPVAGAHNDLYTFRGQDLLFKLKEAGYDLPHTFMHGHDHGGFKLTFEELENPNNPNQTLEFTRFAPGVLAQEHNQGAYGTFCIGHFDTNTQEVMRVEEYRVFTTTEGMQKVMHFADHTVDHDNKKVTAQSVKKIVSEREATNLFEGAQELDPGYETQAASITRDYSKFETPQEALDALEVTFNSMMTMRDAHGEVVKRAINTMQNEYLNMFESDHELTFDEATEARARVLIELSNWAARHKGIDYAKISGGDDIIEDFIRQQVVQAEFGISWSGSAQQPGIKEAIDIQGKKVSEVPFNVGLGSQNAAGLDSVAQRHMWSRYTQHLLDEESTYFSGLNVDLMEQMIDVYKPLNVKRVEGEKLSHEEAIILLFEGYQNGLISPEAFTRLKAYEAVKEFEANKLDEGAIREMVGLTRQEGAQEPLRAPEEQAQSLREQLASPNSRVYNNSVGDYVFTQDGNRIYLPQSLQNEEGLYEPRRFSELLDEGQARLFRGGFGDYQALVNGNLIEINPEVEGFNPTDYEVTPLYEAGQARQEAQAQDQLRQRDALNQLLRRQQAQQARQPESLQEQATPAPGNQNPTLH